MLVTPTAAAGLAREGRIADALQALSEEPPSVATLALALECRLARGEIELALGIGEQLATHRRLSGADAARAALALGELAAATGRDEEAAAHFLRAGEHAGDQADAVELPWRAGAALSLIRAGHHQESRRLALEHLATARAQGSPYAVAGALRTVAAVCSGRREDALREARRILGDDHPRLAATIDTDLAGLLTLMGGATGQLEAVTLLRSAEAYADVEDLWPLHGRVRRLLERLGQQPVPLRCEAIATLTELEHQLAHLAAGGSSNRQIAEQEGLTVKTVEWHLSRAYRKLGIRSRRELPRSLKLV
ncbi:LuxR C-terminal-related transcriptional regulator [Nocardioides sp. GXQ0305]|uniref:LuxR C-terminal-related transcriptional regulator n=1 Tax=Nocardioides sp. GXQ0305 TaxID=3423912 RepID=UPI003D7EE4BC